MAKVCIPQEITDLLKNQIPSKAFREIATLDVEKRTQAITEILDEFSKNNLFSDEADRLLMQKGLEEKIIDIQKERLIKSAQYKRKVEAVGREQPDTFLDKLNQISSIDDFSDELIQEGVEIKLGARLTGEEVKRLVEASKDISQYLDDNGNPNQKAWKTKDEDGNTIIRQISNEYGEAFKNYQNAISSVNPSSFGEQLVATLTSNLLFNVKSPLTNIFGQAPITALFTAESVARYKNSEAIPIATDLAKKDAMFFAKYKYDAARGLDVDAGLRVLGETMARFNPEGGLIEKIAGLQNKIVYDLSLGVPDQTFGSYGYYMTAFGLAKNEVLEDFKNKNIKIDFGNPEFEKKYNNALNFLVNDSLLSEPTSVIGQEIKRASVDKADEITYKQKSDVAKSSSQIRNALDEAGKNFLLRAGVPESIAEGFKIGKYTIPFIMTVSNVITTGAQYSGLNAPVKALGILAFKQEPGLKPLEAIRFTRLENYNNILQDLGEIDWRKPAIGIPAAFTAALFINPEDYIGSYPDDPDERRLIELGRASENSIRVNIGGQEKWVSLDILGPIAAPFIGILEAKKRKDANLSQLFLSYAAGSAMQLTKFPIIEGTKDLGELIQKSIIDYVKDINNGKEDENLIQSTFEASANFLTEFMAAKFLPSIVGDVAESFDTTKRDVKSGQYNVGNINLDPLAIKVPGLRESLPEKLDVFGQEIKTEGVSQVLFGSRVKTPSEDKVVLELEKMRFEGETKTPTDYIGKSAQQYYNIPDNKIPNEKREYGNQVYDAYKEVIQSSDWNTLTLQDKIDALSDAEASVRKSYKDILEERYGKIAEEENK